MSSIIQGIIEGREREDELALALKQAQQITRGVKYDDTVTGIIAEIQSLAGKLGMDPKSVKYAIQDVLEAKNNLESAVYGLDELFKDAWQDEKYKNDDEEEGLTEESKAEIRARLDQAIQDFLDKGGQIEKIKPNRVRAKPGMSMASRHIGTAGEFSRQKRSPGPGMGRQLGAGKPVVNVEEEEKKPRTAKALIYQTEVYGAKGYYGQCKEPGCDHKTKTYDRAVQAQNAIKKHHQEHFKDIEEGYRAGAVGGAGLGIEKSPMEKVLEKPLGEQGVAEGDSGAKYKIKIIGRDKNGDYYISPSTGKKVYKSGVKRGDHENPKTGEHKGVAEEQAPMFTPEEKMVKAKESSIIRGLQTEYKEVPTQRKIVFDKENPPDLYYLYQQFLQRMLNPENKVDPYEWIDKVNKHYGLNYTWKDYQKRGHNDPTNNWQKIIDKYILKKA